jgi:AraC family transcriptional regulator
LQRKQNKMDPKIETLNELKLVGMKTKMSFANNKTRELWQSFMPRKKEIIQAVDIELYSVEVYDPGFFKNFSPANEFEKWAAVKVKTLETVPQNMDSLIIHAGEYAVFHYKGKPSEGQKFYQFIYTQWLPGSGYELDNRPHFALMGEKYKGEDPESEEDIWIPIQKKS